MLTKKECIWLGIRAIGLYWLLQLIYAVIMLIWFIGMWLIMRSRMNTPGGFTLAFVTRLLSIPLPLILIIYFLFFGVFIYKMIHHFVRTRPDDSSHPSGYVYCEIIVRFLGLWTLYCIFSTICMPLRICIQQVLWMCFNPYSSGSNPFRRFFSEYFNPEAILSMGLYLVLLVIVAWYFLKRGKLFIHLLHRLWMKKIGQSPGVQSGL